jgi:three-Cys-motif partner protein
LSDPYSGREQTKAKHFILKRYLQALAFKVLNFSDITYVDGFSGPWQCQTENFSDSSFMIAIQVLKDAQQQVFQRTGKRRRIRCFFSESDPEAFKQLRSAVVPYHKPEEGFEIETFGGKFEDAVSDIRRTIGNAFPLIFIDPTGWSGYPLEKIKALFTGRCEVLINFMYDFVNRFVASQDETIVASLDPILGGTGWRDRLDDSLPRGQAVERLFRETLKSAGSFRYVVSTKIDRGAADRPAFFLAYGTKSPEGLKAFREAEYSALRAHAKDRAAAKDRKREEKSNIRELFSDHEAQVQEETIEQIVNEQEKLASADLLQTLSKHRQLKFSDVVVRSLQAFMLRETNVKDLCVTLARAGKIERTWGPGNRKPSDSNLIKLKGAVPDRN